MRALSLVKFGCTLSAAALALAMLSPVAKASEFPTRPITLMVILGAGGPTDLLARAIAAGMAEQLGKPVIVENKPGANGAVASMAVKRAAPDGYTVLLTANTSHTLTPFVQKGTPHDPVKDFTPVSMVGKYYNVLVVNKNVPAKTFPELMQLAKAKADGVTVATFGMGARSTVAQLRTASGVNLLEIPYADGGKGTQALITGEVDMFFDGTGLARSRVDDGMYRAIAVLSPARLANLPEVPAVAEFIQGFEVPLWSGIVGPAGIPDEVSEKLRKAITASFSTQRVKDAAAALGITQLESMTSEDFGKIIAAEAKENPELVKRYNLSVD